MNAKQNLSDETHDAINSLLDAELNALPERLLQPLILHHFEGHSEEEGARVLGIKLGTFSSRLNRAREHLRARLSNRGVAIQGAALMQNISAGAMSAVP